MASYNGLTDDSQLWHFFGVRNYLGGEVNSPVVEWLNKGLKMTVSSPTDPPGGCAGGEGWARGC
eukprot:9069975-Pyramimonas_sp.AAC.1